MNLNTLSKVGLLTIVAALLIAAVGCSDSNPVISNNSIDEVGGPSLALEGDKTFSTKGIVEKYDVDQRVIQFKDVQYSTTPSTVTVGREAEMVLRSGADPIPFDFKYIEIGTALSVTGERSGSDRIGNLFTLHRGVTEIGINEPSLNAGDEQVGERRYAGTIAKLDEDARVLQFSGSQFDATNPTFYLGREAMVKLSVNGDPMPLNFKYLNIGDYVVLYGTPRALGGADIDLVQLNSGIEEISGNDQPNLSVGDDNAEVGFRLAGVVEKYDIDQRVIQLESPQWSDQASSFTVDREATMQLLPNDVEIPFDFKYIGIGSSLVVEGDLRADGKRVATLVKVEAGNGQIASQTNSL